jgi:hypothetical protein
MQIEIRVHRAEILVPDPSTFEAEIPIEKFKIVKSTVFWNIAPCSPLKDNRRFGGTNCPHLQNL